MTERRRRNEASYSHSCKAYIVAGMSYSMPISQHIVTHNMTSSTVTFVFHAAAQL